MAQPPEDDDSFLSRWSRRKAQARREETEDSAPTVQEPAPEPVAAPEPAPEPDLTPEELAELPRIEDLVPGSDIRAFLRPGVPKTLKNAALRRMWMLTPAIRDHVDPAVDYAWDWNTPGGVPGDGLAPSPERAAQMLRDIVAPRPKPTPEEGAQSPDPALSDPPEDPLAEGAVAASDDAAAQHPKDAGIPHSECDKTPSNQSDTTVPVTPRKHGGAAPI